MSHIVTIETEVRDLEALRSACSRRQLEAPTLQTVGLYSGSVTGHAVKLPDWQYPVVCDLPNGKVHYDNFSGHWGEQKHLNALLQAYTVEKAKIEARKHGHTVTEQTLSDGSIKLTVQVAGGAA